MDDGNSVYNVCADRKIHSPPPVVRAVQMAKPVSGSRQLLPSIRQYARMQTSDAPITDYGVVDAVVGVMVPEAAPEVVVVAPAAVVVVVALLLSLVI